MSELPGCNGVSDFFKIIKDARRSMNSVKGRIPRNRNEYEADSKDRAES